MLLKLVAWLYQVLGHPGAPSLYQTMSQHYYISRLQHTIDTFKRDHCQEHKLLGKGYELLPDRDVVSQPWDEIVVDLIGPWEIKAKNRPVQFNALRTIDTTTNLVKTTRVDNKTCAHITHKFRQCWFSRYPRLQCIVYDGGGELTGQEFKELCQAFDWKTKRSPIHSKEPAIQCNLEKNASIIWECALGLVELTTHPQRIFSMTIINSCEQLILYT